MIPYAALRRLTISLTLLTLSAIPARAQPGRVWPRHLAVTDYPAADADVFNTGNPEVGGAEAVLAPRADWLRPELARHGIQTITRRFHLYAPRRHGFRRTYPRRHGARETLTYDRAGRLLRYELVRRRWFRTDSLLNRFTYDTVGRVRRVAVSGSPVLTVPLVYYRLWEAWTTPKQYVSEGALPWALRTIVIRYDGLSGRPKEYGVEMLEATYATLPGTETKWYAFPATRPLECLLTRPTDTLWVRSAARLLQPASWLLPLDSLAINRTTPLWRLKGDTTAVRRAAATGCTVVQRGYVTGDKWYRPNDFLTAPVSQTYLTQVAGY